MKVEVEVDREVCGSGSGRETREEEEEQCSGLIGSVLMLRPLGAPPRPSPPGTPSPVAEEEEEGDEVKGRVLDPFRAQLEGSIRGKDWAYEGRTWAPGAGSWGAGGGPGPYGGGRYLSSSRTSKPSPMEPMTSPLSSETSRWLKSRGPGPPAPSGPASRGRGGPSG